MTFDLLPGIDHKGLSKLKVSTAIPASDVLLFINTTGSDMAVEWSAWSSSSSWCWSSC